MSTYAKSGTFVTPNFRKAFDPKEFPFYAEFFLHLWIPSSVYRSKTVQLILEIDFDVIESHESRSYERVDVLSSSIEQLESSNERVVKKIALDRRNVNIEFRRHLSREDVDNWSSRRMTGMNVSWYYTSDSVQPDRKYVESDQNLYFRIGPPRCGG